MDKQKQILLIAGLIVFLVILFLIVLVMQKKQSSSTPADSANFNQPTPTTVETRITFPPTVTPTPIPPTQTGVAEEQLSKADQDLAEQKQALKAKLPISEAGYTISFDYAEDKFVVELKTSKIENRAKFESWLNSNYPAIPIDRFLFK